MNKINLLLMLVIVFFHGVAMAQANPNIVDYYQKLPDKYFNCDSTSPMTDETRLKSIKIKDIKNGYIKADLPDTYTVEAALFKNKSKNKDVIGVAINCGAGCMCTSFDFMTMDSSGKWIDAKTEVLPPDLSDREKNKQFYTDLENKFGHEVMPFYVLPRYGAVIEIKDETSHKNIYRLKWNQEKFEKLP